MEVPNHIRIALVGAAGTGKTSFITKAIRKRPLVLEPTIGIDSHRFTVSNAAGPLPVLCWDCAGNPKYKDLVVNVYSSKCEGLLFFYDASKRSTFEPALKSLAEEILSKADLEPYVMIIASKTDKCTDIELVEEGREYAKSKGFDFGQCSIKKDTNDQFENCILKAVEGVLLKNPDRHEPLFMGPRKMAAYLSWHLSRTKKTVYP